VVLKRCSSDEIRIENSLRSPMIARRSMEPINQCDAASPLWREGATIEYLKAPKGMYEQLPLPPTRYSMQPKFNQHTYVSVKPSLCVSGCHLPHTLQKHSWPPPLHMQSIPLPHYPFPLTTARLHPTEVVYVSSSSRTLSTMTVPFLRPASPMGVSSSSMRFLPMEINSKFSGEMPSGGEALSHS
jgi:hypothetical protein